MRKCRTLRNFWLLSLVLLLVTAMGCAPMIAQPDKLVAPAPIPNNTGEFKSPYTSDGVVAEWVDKAVTAKAAGQIGGAVGAYAGAKALEMVPFVGGMLGNWAGEKIGTTIAIKCAGGEEFICNTSDLSFNNVDDMAVYLYVKHSTHPHYQEALDATMAIYPDLKERYSVALANASKGVM